MTLEGRVALVAGASRGIGSDIAKYLARAGAKVAVAARTEVQQDPRLPGTIHSVVQEIADAGGEAIPVVLNLRDPDSIANSVKVTAERFGKLDIVVNDAAIFVPGTIESVQPRHIDLSFSVNRARRDPDYARGDSAATYGLRRPHHQHLLEGAFPP